MDGHRRSRSPPGRGRGRWLPGRSRPGRPQDGVACLLQVSDHLGGVDGVYPENDDAFPDRSFFPGLPYRPHRRADDVYATHPEDARRTGQGPWPVRNSDLHAAPGLVGADQVDQRTHYVRGGDDPDKFPVLDDGEAADPALSHRVGGLLYGIVGENAHHVAGHHVLHQDLLQGGGPLLVPERGGRRAQVPIRDNSHEPPLLEDRKVPDAPLTAQGQSGTHRLIWRERHDLAGHRISYKKHRITPSLIALYSSGSPRVSM